MSVLRNAWIAVPSLLVLTSVLGLAEDDGRVSGCVKPGTGQLRILESDDDSCKANETAVELVTAKDGHVGIGTSTPTEALDVVGNVHATGTIRSGNSIVIDGVTDEILATSGHISFDDENLSTSGSIAANEVCIAGDCRTGWLPGTLPGDIAANAANIASNAANIAANAADIAILDSRTQPVPRELVISAHELEPDVQIVSTPAVTFALGGQRTLSSRVPSDWDGQSTLAGTLLWSSPETSGQVVWNVIVTPAGLGETVQGETTIAFGIGDDADVVSGGLRTSRFFVPASLLERGDLLTVRILRAPGQDTILGDVHLYQVVLSYLPGS